MKSLLASFCCGVSLATAVFLYSGKPLRVSKIELVNRGGKTTMVLDGEARNLTIFDATGRSECVNLGAYYETYGLRMSRETSRRGGICLYSSPTTARLVLGTNGDDIVPNPSRDQPWPPKVVVPYWGIGTASNSKLLQIEWFDPGAMQQTTVQTFTGSANK